MAFIYDITEEDNKAPAIPTSNLMAQRLGKKLRERFEAHIHKRECAETQPDYNVKMASRALAAFTVNNLAGVDEKTAGQSVCDSSLDGGIDAICVNHNEKIMVVVQSKYNQAGNGTWSNDDFQVFKGACEKLQSLQFDRFDIVLQEMADDIRAALESMDYRILFVMTHTGKRGAANNILKDMQQWQDELNYACCITGDEPKHMLPFQVHLVSAEDQSQWFQSGAIENVDLASVEIEQYGKKDEPHPAFYGQVSGDQLVDWWRQFGTKLFTKNLRNLLGITEVNSSIEETALQDPSMFWYFNNGITLLVSEIKPSRRNAARGNQLGSFDFSNASIINGAQTVSTLGRIFKDAEEKPDLMDKLQQIRISARFIQMESDDTESDSKAKAITRANNHQNRVLGRDFASQHGEQQRIAQEMIVDGYHYQLLRSDKPQQNTNSKSIDLDEALNGLACLNGSATILTTLKQNRGKFFDNLDGALYKTIFNPTVSGMKVINAVAHLRVIDELISEKLESMDRQTERKRHLIVTHANRVIASLLLAKCTNIKSASEIITPNATNLSTNIDTLISGIENYIETEHSNAYPARFFSNVERVSHIIKEIKPLLD